MVVRDGDAIGALLTSARLVTLTGPPGVGKTRAGLRAAASAAERFPDGTWLVELSELQDTALLFEAVAVAIGVPGAHVPAVPGADADSLRSAVLDHLRDRRLLLILDTCEHLLDACAVFAETVLGQAREVTVLATSRQPLDAPGEHVFRLPPLGTDDDAVELFARRAVAVMPGFEVTQANRRDVVRLCRRLDGIPLAIELAAVRLRALPLPELADRLEAGFGVLAASRRGATGRHQMLRSAVEWSHDLCPPEEQVLWWRLSVFGGPFDLAAAEEVCADDLLAREQVVHALVGLVDKSVVLCADSGAGPGSGESGYRLPAAVRAFGAEKLATRSGSGAGDGDGRAPVLDRLAARCLSLATRFDQNFLDDDQLDRYRELRREHANLTAALEHTLGDAGPPAPDGHLLARARQGAALTIRLQGYWQMSGLLSEGRYWLGKVLQLLPARAPEHAWALGIDGRLATFAGDLDGALAQIRESIRLAVDLGEPLTEALGYLYLNLALTLAGSRAEALAAGETARRTMTACDHRLGLIALEGQLGHLHQLTGDADLAIDCCERGLALLGPSSGERWITSYLHLVSGFALLQRPDRSQECAVAVRRALAATHEIGDVVGIAYALEVLGWLAARGGRFDEAARLLGAADPLWRQTAGRLSGAARLEQTHQRVAGQVREALGERRFAAAYAKGMAMPLEDVARHAISMPSFTDFDPAGADAPPGAGARGRVTAELASASAPVSARLTRREQEIAGLVASGLSNREIAAQLVISKRTVDAHVDHIFGKLQISSRVQLTVWLATRVATR